MTARITLIALLFINAASFLGGQAVNVEHFKALAPRSIGPAGMSGRITSIDVDLSNPDIIYAGAASGGVWKSVSGGIDWQPVFDEQPVQAIGAVAIDQNTPDVVWVGTGEGNPRNSHNTGEGVFKSLDGGATWTCMGLKETRNIHRILIHRDNPDVVYVAAFGTIWGPNEARGVYRTVDGGKNWEKVLYVNEQTGCADLVVDPTNPNKLIAAMYEYGRRPWTYNSGGPGSGLYVSLDGGETWTERTEEDGLPKGELGRIGLAIAPSKPNIVYALIEAEKNALYKSTDGGRKWKKIADKNIGNRPFYYADIFVDPKNENRLYNLYSLVSRSEDGGKTFETILPYSEGVHPDHHAMWIHPDDPDFMINGNDGGLYITRDGGENWRFAENLPVGQFYHVSYDMSIPYRVGGGMQDNGSWVGPSRVWQSGGIRNHHWQEVYFGDGFDVNFQPDDPDQVYAMSQGGNLAYIDLQTGKSMSIQPVHPEGEELRFNWNAALAQDPFAPCGVYYGSQYVHYSNDCGQSWEIISPDLTTDDPEKQKQDESGGLTIDDTQAENHTTILAVAPSPVDRQVIWVGADDGNLQLTRDGGRNWTNLADRLPGVKAGSWFPFIEVSRKEAGEAFVVVNDYRRNDYRPMVFHTDDYGATFRRIVDENQVHGHALSIVQDPVEPKLLWLGADYGLYFSIDRGKTWNKWDEGFPSVSTSDLKIHPREHDLIVGTFGRSLWILDDIRPIREVARTGGEILEEPFRAFPAPDAYLAEYKSVAGTRFAGDGIYRGENQRSGAMLTLWVKPGELPAPEKETEAMEMEEEEEEEETSEKQEGEDKKARRPKKVNVRVIDAAGDTIRTFSEEVDTGMVRLYWNLRRDGVAFPSRRERKPDADPPTGPEVLPGDYKLVFTYGDFIDSTVVTVQPDPRLDLSLADRKAQDAAYDSFAALVEKATAAFKQLREARKTIKRVDTALEHAPDSTKKEIAKLGKSLQDSLDQLEKQYMEPENQKGIQRNSEDLNSTLYSTYYRLRSSEGEPNQAARVMMEKTRKQTTEILEKVNAFMQHDFAEYRKKVEAVRFSLFEEMEPVELGN